VGVPRTAPIFWVPLSISGTGKATNVKFGRYIQRVHPNKSQLKFGRKWSVGVYRNCPIFLSTPIISGTGKATNLKFCTHILSIDRNKSPLQISGKVAGCVVRILNTFHGTHILGASRGLLCDSSAVLFAIRQHKNDNYQQWKKVHETDNSVELSLIVLYCWYGGLQLCRSPCLTCITVL